MKNTYRPSENGGLTWLADEGAREAVYDGQGSLVKVPEKERPLTDYERLLDGLYEAALELTGERVHDHRAVEALAFFLDGLSLQEAAHQLREGIRDAAYEKTSIRFVSAETALKEQIGRVIPDFDRALVDACVSANPPPADDTPSSEALQGWSEEEINVVRLSAESYGGYSAYAKYKHTYFCGSDGKAAGVHARLAAIAEHLAKMEG